MRLFVHERRQVLLCVLFYYLQYPFSSCEVRPAVCHEASGLGSVDRSWSPLSVPSPVPADVSCMPKQIENVL